MPAYITRWMTGDFSITVKPNKKAAIQQFDPLDAADNSDVHRMSECTLHFTLTPEGTFILDFNEVYVSNDETAMAILDQYPELRNAVVQDDMIDLTDPQLPEKFATGAKQVLQKAADDWQQGVEETRANLEDAWTRSAKH